MNENLKPAFHRPIPLETRILIPKGTISDKDRTGIVVGIATKHVIFTYIVLLDEGSEFVDSDGVHRAINFPGNLLHEIDGTPFRNEG